ncbi:serine/threonine-protein kinase [Paenarthrobacter sp. YJN-5]|uniref:serine/threonine-protein kinase n=1 Tax=Paenarthrobacter sp. YJN-5 TaxID=2735316 RepID=UPI00351C2AF0
MLAVTDVLGTVNVVLDWTSGAVLDTFMNLRSGFTSRDFTWWFEPRPGDHASNAPQSGSPRAGRLLPPTRLQTNATDVGRARASAVPMPPPPGRYSNYVHVGSGGFADVFEARDSQGHRVAIKRLRRSSRHDEISEKYFRREARLHSVLQSPGLPKLIEQRLDAEPPFFVMEFIDGLNMADWVRTRGCMTDKQVRRTASRTIHALNEIHSRQFLHRDIKPSNVMVSETRAVLLDLGIGKDLASASSASAAHVGTWSFAAPEYFLSKTAESQASDVFSWGAMLAFGATGRMPYGDRSGPALLNQVLKGTLDEEFLAALKRFGRATELGGALSGIILQCVDPDPVVRPTSYLLNRLINKSSSS